MKFSIQRFTIYGTTENETIRNTQRSVEIYAYGGNDSVYNNGAYATIHAGEGNDTIQNYTQGYRGHIDGEDGDDYIYGFFAYSELKGGAGNDTIYLRHGDGYGGYTTITGGKGDDSIVADGGNYRVYQYASGDGNDTVYYARATDTLNVTEGQYSTEISGADLIVKVGSGSVTFKNTSSLYINGSSSDAATPVNLRNTKSYVALTGTAENDTVYNSGKHVTITTGDGDDSIYHQAASYSGSYITVNAGAGNDTILGRYGNSSISGGDGNDLISLAGDTGYATINPGKGDDTIRMDGYNGCNLLQYAEGDGNEVIYSLTSNDTIHIASGSLASAYAIGDDVFLNIGSGSMTLKNAARRYFYLKTGDDSAERVKFVDPNDGEVIANIRINTLIAGTELNDTIRNSASGVTINGMGGNDVISLNGGSSVIQYEEGGGFDTVYGATSRTTLSLADKDYGSVRSGNDIIVTLSGGGVTFKNASTVKIVDPSVGKVIANTRANTLITGTERDDTIRSTASGVTINGLGGNDVISLNGSGVIQYEEGGGFDTVYGATSRTTLSLADKDYGSVRSGNDIIVTLSGGGVTFKNASNVKIVDPNVGVNVRNSLNGVTVSGGGGNDTVYSSGRRVTITTGAGDDSINNYSTAYSGLRVLVDAGDGNDTIVGRYGDSSINAGAGDDVISLSGDTDGMTVDGGAGNDLIYNDGYDGYNVFKYSAGGGDDTIVGFTKNDTLSISGDYATIQSGNGLLYSVKGGGSVLLKNYVPSGVSLSNYTKNTVLNGTSIGDTIRNYAGGVKIYAGGGNDSIYSSTDSPYTINSSHGYVTIDGGDGNDRIYSSDPYVSISGGDGNDSISISGAGNGITVNGGSGNDVIRKLNGTEGITYQYYNGDGDDTIYGFTSLDKLKITGTSTTVQNGSDLIYTVGTGSILLKNYTPNTGVNLTNSTSHRTITGTTYNDTIKNVYNSGGDYVYISAGGGNDSIRNERGWYITVNGGSGNDSITDYNGNGNSLNAGSGNDLISLKSNSGISTVYAGSGDDTIYGDTAKGYGVVYQFLSGDGNDLIYNYHSNDTITGATFTTVRSGSNVVLSATGGGKVTLVGAATLLGIFSEEADSFTNTTSATVLNALGGNDTLVNNASRVTIYAGDGNDSITNTGNSSLIDLGDGNDSLYSSASSNTIVTGSGKDFVSLTGTANTITGSDYDTVYSNGGNVYVYDGATAVIRNFAGTDTISIAGGVEYKHSSPSSNTRVLNITGGGRVTLIGSVYVAGGEPATGVVLTNSENQRTLTGTSHGDTITNVYNGGGDTVSISAGAGNDSILNDWGYYVTIDAGAGDDSITVNKASGNSISGGAGADLISLSGSQGVNTVRGGAGNDTIYGDGAPHLYEYSAGDGNDIIRGWNARDTLAVSGGETAAATVGNDVVVSIGSGAVTLVGAKGKAVNISGGEAVDNTSSQRQVIQTFMGVLDTVNSDGVGRLNRAVSVASGGYFSNISAAINKMVSDCRNASSAEEFLLDKCGIILGNDDTGAISGSDAGGASVKTASSIVEETGSVNNFTGNSFTTNGLTVQLASIDYYGNPTAINYSSITNARQRYIWQAFQTWWASGALDLIAESYGDNYSFTGNSSATTKKLYFGFERENSSTMAVTYFDSDNSDDVYRLAMTVNMYNYAGLIIGDSDGRIRGEDDFYLDRVLAHEMTHAVMAANIRYFGDLPDFIAEGMAELTHGVDDDRYDEILELAASPNALRSALSLYSGNYDSYAGGYMFLRYLAKQGAEHSSSANVRGSNGMAADDGVVVGSEGADSITGTSGNDTISGNVGNDTIRGGAGADFLAGDAGNDRLYGDGGDDTLFGGYGNDTLTGGAGADVFIHVSGSDVITDYTAGADKIRLSHEDLLSAQISGGSVILRTTSGSVTVKNGKGRELTVIGRDGAESAYWFTADDTLIAGGNSGARLSDISAADYSLTDTATDWENSAQPVTISAAPTASCISAKSLL